MNLEVFKLFIFGHSNLSV